jgi:hypothetical protein
MGVRVRAGGGPTAAAGWVGDADVPAFVGSLAELAGRPFDDADRAALAKGLDGTDADDPGSWFSLAFAGATAVTVDLAAVRGTGVTLVQVWYPDDGEVRARVDALLTH